MILHPLRTQLSLRLPAAHDIRILVCAEESIIVGLRRLHILEEVARLLVCVAAPNGHPRVPACQSQVCSPIPRLAVKSQPAVGVSAVPISRAHLLSRAQLGFLLRTSLTSHVPCGEGVVLKVTQPRRCDHGPAKRVVVVACDKVLHVHLLSQGSHVLGSDHDSFAFSNRVDERRECLRMSRAAHGELLH